MEEAGAAPTAAPASELPVKPLKRVDSLDTESSRVAGMPDSYASRRLSTGTILRLAFQSIGVVYGDVGTSPLYVYSSTYSLNQTDAAGNSIPALHDDILGVLSLIIYTLTLIPVLKYCFIVLKANDNGNGGTFALYSLICRHAKISLATNQGPEDRDLSSYQLDLPTRTAKRAAKVKEYLERSKFMQRLLLVVALCGTCAVIGDGVLTPSISVLSAISGIKVNTPSLSQSVVVWVSIVILIALFCFQRFGTDKVGYTFAPCVLTWFICIGVIGVYNICKHDPTVFKAFNPYYIYSFFQRNKMGGWVSLGGVVLAITGTEAMFADLAHFSVPSIQISCTALVYPCLLLAYIGQAAFLVKNPDLVSVTFYKSIPTPVYWPMFVVATAAAVIASQAMISATFSIVDQSMALGCFPRCKVVHTSAKYEGQIYIPEINWILMILCVIVTGALRDTTIIGNAYGVAVVAVMVVTTVFLTLIMVMIWQTSLWLALTFLAFFGAIELFYFSSVLYKVPQYGWIPLVFVAVFLSIMYTWYYARKEAYRFEVNNKLSLDWVLGLGSNLGMARVPGIGLVYTELAQGVPAIFAHLINNLPAMHSTLMFVCVKRLPVPSVPNEERILLRRIGPPEFRMYRCAVRYGYKDNEREGDEFEELLMASLADFIRAEAAGALNHNKSSSSLPTAANNPTSVQIDADPHVDDDASNGVFVTGGGPHRANGARTGPMKLHARKPDLVGGTDPPSGPRDEVEYLREAKQSGVVYILGHTDLRAKKESNFFRKFIIDDFYGFLRRNSRSSSRALNIPHTRLLEVGMLHYI